VKEGFRPAECFQAALETLSPPSFEVAPVHFGARRMMSLARRRDVLAHAKKRGFRHPADLPAECASLKTQIGAGGVPEKIVVGRAARLLQQRAAHYQTVRRYCGGARGDGGGCIIARESAEPRHQRPPALIIGADIEPG
jgi:hypothetical protein